MDTSKEAPEEEQKELSIAEKLKELVKRPNKKRTNPKKTAYEKAIRNQKKCWTTTKSFTSMKKK